MGPSISAVKGVGKIYTTLFASPMVKRLNLTLKFIFLECILSQCHHADQHNIHQMVRWQTVHENKPINIKPSVNCLWTNILAYHHVTIIITSPYAHSWLKCQMMKPNKLISNNLGGFVIGHKPIIAHGQYSDMLSPRHEARLNQRSSARFKS